MGKKAFTTFSKQTMLEQNFKPCEYANNAGHSSHQLFDCVYSLDLLWFTTPYHK